MENKFKKGLLLGGLLAVGAAVGLSMTKEGKKLTTDVQKDFKTLAKHIKADLGTLEDVTKESFDNLVARVVEEYDEKKKMAADAKKSLIHSLQATWHEMEIEYLSDKKNQKK